MREACVAHKFWNAPLRRCRDGSVLASGTMALETSVHTLLRSYRHVDVFICPSEFMARKMGEARAYPDKMHVLRHFVDLADTPTKSAPGGEVLLAGRLVSEKAVDTAIRAIALVPGDARLHIAGDRPVRAEMEALAADVAPGRVVFHGRLPKDELHALLRASCVTVMSSRWYENQPLAVLESLANGVPVVATDLGGTPSWSGPASTANWCPPISPSGWPRPSRRSWPTPTRPSSWARPAASDRAGVLPRGPPGRPRPAVPPGGHAEQCSGPAAVACPGHEHHADRQQDGRGTERRAPCAPGGRQLAGERGGRLAGFGRRDRRWWSRRARRSSGRRTAPDSDGRPTPSCRRGSGRPSRTAR